ncbi:MAG TPA: substrate-binding domain-containing protein [Devosia sp.]|jgi:LacI family transcriptional regulator|uniref:LacI family DNA-binding transcriptional regulator n=1 Tax=Devosia sp. TaxID=1871048 RepID=UPI002DDD1715|nr:substrate-binding domain-containing protein [Devosia sp.]HEV2516178.1 substrate-binding domain-containing protein [Devosia sp.]
MPLQNDLGNVATLRSIGESLGLSPATVSRALNGFPEVGEATRLRVIEAARQLDYRPNQVARKLVSGRSGIVGLVVDKPRSLATDTTFFGVISELSASLAARDVDLVLHVSTDMDEVEPYRRLLAKGTLDGFILSGPRPDDARISFLETAGANFVVHGRHAESVSYPYFDIDNRAVSELAVELLCDLGHRRIALVNGPADLAFSADRLHGFQTSLQQRGRSVPSRSVVHGPMTEQQGYITALRMFNGEAGQRPTGIVCGSTVLAAGVMRAAIELGLDIPGDVSIVSHDDDVPQLPAAGFAVPLTTTWSPLTSACAPLVEILLARVAGELEPGRLQHVAGPDLVLRRSTGAARDKGEWVRTDF